MMQSMGFLASAKLVYKSISSTFNDTELRWIDLDWIGLLMINYTCFPFYKVLLVLHKNEFK